MDDIGEFVAGLVLFFIGVYLALMAIVWLVTVALPFLIVYVGLPAAGYGFLGRQFYTQLQEYRLTAKSWSVVGTIAGIAILVSVIAVSALGLNGLWVAPISVLLFLAVSVSVLAMWAQAKTKDILGEGRTMRADLARLNSRIRHDEAQIASLSTAKREFEEQFGELIEKKQALDTKLRELCSMDARIYSIKCKEWENSIHKLPESTLPARKQEYVRGAKNRDADNARRIENAIKLVLVRLEELDRQTGSGHKSYEANKAQLEKATHEQSLLKQQAAVIETQLSKNNQDYRALKESRIILN